MQNAFPPAGSGVMRSALGMVAAARDRVIARVESNPALFLALSAIGLLAYLTLRNMGAYPVVFADEWAYSMGIRHLSPAQAIYPSPLYYALFRFTGTCGERFLECARLYNAGLIAASLPFIYLVARQYVAPWIAVFVATLTVFGPINSHALYLMPESMYFFLFWVLAWIMLGALGAGPLWQGTGAGLILGLMINVKFHAVFLVAGLIAYLALRVLHARTRVSLRTFVVTSASLVLVFAVSAFAMRAWFLGGSSAPLSSSYYVSMAQAWTWEQLQRLVPNAGTLFLLNGLGVVLLFALPSALLIDGLRRPDTAGKFPGSRQSLRFYLLTLLLLLVAVVSLFNAFSTGSGPYEVPGRLSMRIYSFLFPLFLILAASETQQDDSVTTERSRVRWILAVLVGMPVVVAYVMLSRSYEPGIVDSPDLMGLFVAPGVFLGATILGLFSLVLWGFWRRAGAVFYLFCLAPVLMLTANSNITAAVYLSSLRPQVHDSAGEFTRQYLGQASSTVTVVTSDLAGLYRTRFHLDTPAAGAVMLPPGAPVGLPQLGTAHSWALIIGEHPLQFEPERMISMGEFVLVKLPTDSLAIDFRQGLNAAGVTAYGLGTREPHGRWSTGKTVELQFDSLLPGRFELELVAHAFGPNVGKSFQVTVGDQTRSVMLGDTAGDAKLAFDPPRASRLMTITVPAPTSPQQLGVSSDERQLGIALQSIRIRALGRD